MEQEYLRLLREVLESGERRPTRAKLASTGQTVDALSVFGRQARFDLGESFPALTTKRLFFRGVVAELLWIVRGETNVASLRAQNVTIWDEWANEGGDLGPVYGKQWRRWETRDGRTVDQLARVVEGLAKDPHGRRHVVSAWNAGDLDAMALPPCHVLFQFYVSRGRLSCQLYQRSADIFLGVPFNLASYALLTCMVAQVVGLERGEFVHTFGDLHLYANHVEQAREQLAREPRPAPRLRLDPAVRSIDDFDARHITLEGYEPHPKIDAEVAI